MDLREYFSLHPRVAVGFSGGTDSALLLWAACRYAEDCIAIVADTPFVHREDLRSADEVCRILGIEPVKIRIDLTDDPAIMANGPDRCYLCKRRIFGEIVRTAGRMGYDLVADGTNASDVDADRPGVKALRELGVVSPLRECGLTKDDVRRMSRDAGLPTWDRPSNSCLATRMDTGIPLDMDVLERAHEAELELAAMGYRDHRVRTDGWAARVQLSASQFPETDEERERIVEAVSHHIQPVSIDDKTR